MNHTVFIGIIKFNADLGYHKHSSTLQNIVYYKNCKVNSLKRHFCNLK